MDLNPMPGGRPPKFNPQLCERFLTMIRNGHWFRYACASVGVDKETVRRWLKRGERTGDLDAEYREFRAHYLESRVQAQIAIEANIISTAMTDAEIGLKVMAKLARERWGSDDLRKIRKDIRDLQAALLAGGAKV